MKPDTTTQPEVGAADSSTPSQGEPPAAEEVAPPCGETTQSPDATPPSEKEESQGAGEGTAEGSQTTEGGAKE